ncbi:hypothetical protein LCGC14_1133300 [marine sediment metagenome]|uniref:Calcineurin-like phosphoesterase domain-containing protein n=1 Tax=marine sediment metagenome TaxID=412755 RepID=A0A0F9M5D5_9ZZZZ
MSYAKRWCDYDQCCEFEPRSWNQVYCYDVEKCGGCSRKAENERRRVNEAALFEIPREYKTLKIPKTKDGYKIIIVNDTQIPFQDDKTLRAVEGFWNDFQPDLELYNGDILDFYNISDFSKNPTRRFKVQDELDATHQWLFNRANAVPSARRILIDGNHEDRLRRWLWKYGADIASLRDMTLDKLLDLEDLGVENIPYNSVVDFLGYRVEHGYKSSASKAYPVAVARWMAIATGSSGLCGHTHHFGTYSWTDAKGTHSYIENGCLCRLDLEYAPFPNWQQAFTYGVVKNNKVHLVPVMIYEDGFMTNGEWYSRR